MGIAYLVYQIQNTFSPFLATLHCRRTWLLFLPSWPHLFAVCRFRAHTQSLPARSPTSPPPFLNPVSLFTCRRSKLSPSARGNPEISHSHHSDPAVMDSNEANWMGPAFDHLFKPSSSHHRPMKRHRHTTYTQNIVASTVYDAFCRVNLRVIIATPSY
jgi:hypothetical protein